MYRACCRAMGYPKYVFYFCTVAGPVYPYSHGPDPEKKVCNSHVNFMLHCQQYCSVHGCMPVVNCACERLARLYSYTRIPPVLQQTQYTPTPATGPVYPYPCNRPSKPLQYPCNRPSIPLPLQQAQYTPTPATGPVYPYPCNRPSIPLPLQQAQYTPTPATGPVYPYPCNRPSIPLPLQQAQYTPTPATGPVYPSGGHFSIRGGHVLL